MFSSRLSWDVPHNRLSQALEARRRAGGDILDLTESNPTCAGYSYPADDLLDALADRRALVYEPAPAGIGYNFIKWYVPQGEQKYTMSPY